MGTDGTNKGKKLVIPILFCAVLILTVILNFKMREQPKEEMCTRVSANVTGIKIKNSKFNPGSLKVTAKYEGREYELKGVPFNAYYSMKTSRAFGSKVEAWLYDGALYYAPNCISTWIDKVYYFCLAGTVLSASLILVQVTEKYRST